MTQSYPITFVFEDSLGLSSLNWSLRQNSRPFVEILAVGASAVNKQKQWVNTNTFGEMRLGEVHFPNPTSRHLTVLMGLQIEPGSLQNRFPQRVKRFCFGFLGLKIQKGEWQTFTFVSPKKKYFAKQRPSDLQPEDRGSGTCSTICQCERTLWWHGIFSWLYCLHFLSWNSDYFLVSRVFAGQRAGATWNKWFLPSFVKNWNWSNRV